MKQPFDIFWFGETGRNWIEAVDTLEIAKAHIEKLPQYSQAVTPCLTRGRATEFHSLRRFRPVQLSKPSPRATRHRLRLRTGFVSHALPFYPGLVKLRHIVGMRFAIYGLRRDSRILRCC